MPLKLLTALDIYGHPIGVHYNNQSVYKTWVGSLFTLLTYALILMNTVELISKFRTKSD